MNFTEEVTITVETTRPSLRAFTSFLLAIITIISYLSICCRSDCARLHGYTSCPKLIPLKSQSLHKGVYMHNELYDTLIHIIEHNRKEQCLLFPEHPQLFLKVCYLQYLLILAVQCENTIEMFLWEICNFFFQILKFALRYSWYVICPLNHMALYLLSQLDGLNS